MNRSRPALGFGCCFASKILFTGCRTLSQKVYHFTNPDSPFLFRTDSFTYLSKGYLVLKGPLAFPIGSSTIEYGPSSSLFYLQTLEIFTIAFLLRSASYEDVGQNLTIFVETAGFEESSCF